jgi:hypothetical protein
MAALALPVPSPMAQALPDAAARDAPWELAILAERVGKLHVQAGQGMLAARARRSLAEAMRAFDASLAEAAREASGAEVRERYILLALLWQEYRPLASRPATREGARRMAERTEELAWVAFAAARASPAQSTAARRAAEAAQGAVLAQRVARLHLLRRWDVRDEGATRELAAAAAQLRAILERLQAEPGNSAAAAAELQVARDQHVFLERALRELASTPVAAAPLEAVAKTCDNIVESLRRVAQLYAVPLSASAPG